MKETFNAGLMSLTKMLDIFVFIHPNILSLVIAGSCLLQMQMHRITLIALNDCCIYWVAKRNGMNNNEQARVGPVVETRPLAPSTAST